MKRVCVFAGSSAGSQPQYRGTAEELGRVLAARQIGLVYGGARVGLMGVVADAVLASQGQVTGVIPAALVAKEVAHNGLTELRVVGSMHERKAVMADLSDACSEISTSYERSVFLVSSWPCLSRRSWILETYWRHRQRRQRAA